MTKKRTAPVEVTVNPNHQRASTPSKLADRAPLKIMEPSKSLNGNEVSEPSVARDLLAPIINFVHEHLTADDVGLI